MLTRPNLKQLRQRTEARERARRFAPHALAALLRGTERRRRARAAQPE